MADATHLGLAAKVGHPSQLGIDLCSTDSPVCALEHRLENLCHIIPVMGNMHRGWPRLLQSGRRQAQEVLLLSYDPDCSNRGHPRCLYVSRGGDNVAQVLNVHVAQVL